MGGVIHACTEEELGRKIRQYLKDHNSEKITEIKNTQGEELIFPTSTRLCSDEFCLRRGLSMAQLEKVLIAASRDA